MSLQIGRLWFLTGKPTYPSGKWSIWRGECSHGTANQFRINGPKRFATIVVRKKK